MEAYAVKRLSPFLGVIEILETENGRAISLDGVSWQIQVAANRPRDLWDSGEFEGRQFFRFGVWTVEEGLMRAPVNPILDIGAMLSACDKLLTNLEQQLAHLPFALNDRFELWLLDREQQPLALLASATEQDRLKNIDQSVSWVATAPMEFGFESPTLLRQGIPAKKAQHPRYHAEQLEQLIGTQTDGRTQWFERQQDGSARAINLKANQERIFAAECFPELLLRTGWPKKQQQLVDDYFAWLAPWLLTLSHLTTETRHWLEQQACQQALRVDAFYRLYPQILAQDRLNTARVEARLRKSAINKEPTF